MNIFFLDENIEKNVKMYCDQHCRKMLVETAQLLSFVYYFTGQKNLAPYKLTHPNHPCAKWTRENLNNWILLLNLGKALHKEYQYRFAKNHKSGILIDEYFKIPDLPNKEMTNPPIVVSPESLIINDIYESYRNLYIHKFLLWKTKNMNMLWTKRDIPYFIKNIEK